MLSFHNKYLHNKGNPWTNEFQYLYKIQWNKTVAGNYHTHKEYVYLVSFLYFRKYSEGLSLPLLCSGSRMLISHPNFLSFFFGLSCCQSARNLNFTLGIRLELVVVVSSQFSNLSFSELRCLKLLGRPVSFLMDYNQYNCWRSSNRMTGKLIWKSFCLKHLDTLEKKKKTNLPFKSKIMHKTSKESISFTS